RSPDLTLGLALLFTLQHAAVNQPRTQSADERRRHSALAGNLAVRPPRPLRVFQKRLDSASLVLQRTIAAVRFVCTDRIKDRGPLRALTVDRLVYLSLDRLALERPRRADAMKTVCQIELRSGCEYDNRREHRAVFHRFRIALDELVVVTTHLRRALADHISQGYLNHRNLRRRVPVVLMPCSTHAARSKPGARPPYPPRGEWWACHAAESSPIAHGSPDICGVR